MNREIINVNTSAREQMIDITSNVQKILNNLKIKDGICQINTLHTTAGLTINENADPSVKSDILMGLSKMVSDNWNYTHGEGNSSAHIKSSLMGASLSIPVYDGKLLLGTWQGICFCEFDGPRSRKVVVTIS